MFCFLHQQFRETTVRYRPNMTAGERIAATNMTPLAQATERRTAVHRESNSYNPTTRTNLQSATYIS